MIGRIITIAAVLSTLGASPAIASAGDGDPTREEVEEAFITVVLELVGDDDPIVACALNDSVGLAWYLCFSQARRGGGEGEFVLLRGVPDRGAHDDPDKNSPAAWDWDVTDAKTGESLADAQEGETTLADVTLSACILGLPESEVRKMAVRNDHDADLAVALWEGLVATGECG